MVYLVTVDGRPYRLEVQRQESGWNCLLDGREIQADAVMTRRNVLSLLIAGRSYEIKCEQTAVDLHLWVGSTRFNVELRDPRALRSRKDGPADEKGPRKLLAPMHGRLVRVLAAEKSAVEAGQGIVVVEAMKMQNEIRSPKKGTVTKILFEQGATVNAGNVLAIVE